MTTCGFCGSPLGPTRPSVVHTRRTGNPRKELERTELEISRVQVLLDELMQKRSFLKQEINDRFCPALQLPPEISTEIFSHCLPSIESYSPSEENMTPFLLGQICRTWRHFTWSTPRLWSTMCLDLSFQTNISLIKQWLAYSSQQPLSIRISCGQCPPIGVESGTGDREEIFADVVDVIAQFSERLYIVDIGIPERCYYDPDILSVISDPLPLLSSVSLHNFNLLWSEPCSILYVAPRLDEVRLSNCRLGEYYLHMLQIKRVWLRDAFLDECLAVLGTTSLTHCTLVDIKETDGLTPVTAVIRTSRLKSLTVNSTWGISQLLDRLMAPDMLNLDVVVTNVVLPLSKFVLFIKRSSCPLQSLSLSGVGIYGTQLFECLQLIPSLVELELSSISLRDEIVQLLGPFPTPGHSQCLLPNLRVLGYKGRLNFNSLSISGILLFRWRQGTNSRVAQLRRVNLKTILHISDVPAISQYRQLVAEGLDLSIGTDRESWL
jgi:F-box-like